MMTYDFAPPFSVRISLLFVKMHFNNCPASHQLAQGTFPQFLKQNFPVIL